jgi:hypothetical protein
MGNSLPKELQYQHDTEDFSVYVLKNRQFLVSNFYYDPSYNIYCGEILPEMAFIKTLFPTQDNLILSRRVLGNKPVSTESKDLKEFLVEPYILVEKTYVFTPKIVICWKIVGSLVLWTEECFTFGSSFKFV